MRLKKPVYHIAVFAMLGSLILAGCGGAAAEPTPTVDIQSTLVAIQTESALTVVAGLTQNAPTSTLTPTETAIPTATTTLEPTNTPPAMLTSTATFVPWTPTSTSVPTQSAYNCSVLSVSPAFNSEFTPNADFDAVWEIKNTGRNAWTAADTDLVYHSGATMQKHVNAVDLANDVAPGGTYTVRIDMLAPSTTGTHTTNWAVTISGQVICTMSLTIRVK